MEFGALVSHPQILPHLSLCKITTYLLFSSFLKNQNDSKKTTSNRNAAAPWGFESLPCLSGSGRKKNKILCLPLVISKLLCLPDGFQRLNYYTKCHFENVSFAFQRHQIWNVSFMEFQHNPHFGPGRDITKGLRVLLSYNPAMLTDHRWCCLGR